MTMSDCVFTSIPQMLVECVRLDVVYMWRAGVLFQFCLEWGSMSRTMMMTGTSSCR